MKNYVKKEIVSSIDANYIVIIGGRNNGKSFACSSDLIERAWKNHTEFGYITRYDKNCKDSIVSLYFDDKRDFIKKLTKGACDCIDIYRKNIYFSKTDDTGKIKHIRKCGYCFALNVQKDYKSLQFPLIEQCIFEEFVADDGIYLFQEMRKFYNLMSTIFRDRAGRIYLVGNTISRNNPYYTDWSLFKGVSRQKINTIDYYSFNNDQTKVAVYLTAPLDYPQSLFIGHERKSLHGEEYVTDIYPKLSKPRERYDCIYTMVFCQGANTYLMEFLKDPQISNSFVWYVTPKTTPIQKGTRVISDVYNDDILFTLNFYPLSAHEKVIFFELTKGNIVYSDNLTATEFNASYDAMMHKR